MRQVARWYDVEVVYRGAVSGHFGGSISRGASLSRVLEILESTGGVKCTIENKQIIVMP